MLNKRKKEGGIVTRYKEARPEILSKDILLFECGFLLRDYKNPNRVGMYDGYYRFRMDVKDGKTYLCILNTMNRYLKCLDIRIEMTKELYQLLSLLVEKYNLKEMNGYTHYVSGILAGLGSYLSITYKTGEALYASSNQENIFPLGFINEMLILIEKEESNGI